MNSEDTVCGICGSPKIKLLVSEACPNGCEMLEVVECEDDEEGESPFRTAKLMDSFLLDQALRDGKMQTARANPAAIPNSIDEEGTTPTSLYSTLELDPLKQNTPLWQLFEYGRSQQIPESGRLATRAETNVPRASYGGLPQGWSAKVFGWRVSLNLPVFEPVVREWAMRTQLSFHYNRKTYFESPLSDFLGVNNDVNDVNANSINDERAYLGELPEKSMVYLRENLDYGVTVESSAAATSTLKRWLATTDLVHADICQSGIPSPRDQFEKIQILQQAATRLETLAEMSSPVVANQLRSVVQVIQPRRTLILRVHLNCLMKSAVC